MEFLQPYWLWGMLAVAVPVAIHFWNQKKGTTIEWAASRWLLDKNTLNHRGIRLHEIPLMLLRCLLVILLALLLGKPVMDWLNNTGEASVIHLVQPEKQLVDNYRFELENALKKGEKIYWVSPETREIDEISQMPAIRKSVLYLQQSVNKLASNGVRIKLYVVADQELTSLPKIYVPASFELYPLADSSRQEVPLVKFGKSINVLVAYKDEAERATVEAALKALGNTYQIPFSMDLKATQGKNFNWILTDSLPKQIDFQTLYLVSGKATDVALPANVIQIPDSLKLSTSAIVESGGLPEFLGEALLKHNGLTKQNGLVSSRQLRAMFVQTKSMQDKEAGQMRKWLLLIFVLTALLERWISLRKTQVSTYA